MNFNFNTLSFENNSTVPDKLAVAGSDCDLTWAELSAVVNKITNLFSSINVPESYPIIIYGHKEALFPAFILACLKMKIPYVPVDTELPKERLKKIATVCKSEFIICLNDKRYDEEFKIVVDKNLNVHKNEFVNYGNAVLKYNETAAYILFTSGTTGEPKGVVISTDAVKSYIFWAERIFCLNDADVFANQASYSFDISLFDTFLAFKTGGTLVLNAAEVSKNSEDFVARIKKYKCTIWNSTPSFVTLQLPNPSFSFTDDLPLKKFILCGEELNAKLVNKLHERFPSASIINAYGPTEATVVTTHITITPVIAEKYSKNLPIGYPKDDGEILIINDAKDSEKEGELVIVGNHVALGYINNKSQTEKKFYTYNGMRAYRTGDYGYYKNGQLFFSGRKDDQVKLNGYRIELSEINDCIEKCDAVISSVTLPFKANNVVKKIVSFIKAKQLNMSPQDIKKLLDNHISASLPEYMVPADYFFVDDFPVSNSFKIDKVKLIEMYMNA